MGSIFETSYCFENKFWTLSLNTLNNIIEKDADAMAKIWQALIFSLFKKVLFNHSRNNYLYTNIIKK